MKVDRFFISHVLTRYIVYESLNYLQAKLQLWGFKYKKVDLKDLEKIWDTLFKLSSGKITTLRFHIQKS